MCGIVGFTGEHQAAPILLDGLSKLEYRGYDSAGIAVRDGSADAEIIKAKGRLKVLAEKTNDGESVKGTCGIGHTRWATHGEPSENNAHPHASDDGNVVAVHNGIIENYQELKDKLVRKGYTFYSETDTEVAVKLIDYYYKKYEGTPVDAINHALVRIRGSYALAIMFRDYPEEIYVARKDSPMILGVANGEAYIGPDVPAILKYTRTVYYVDNQEVVELREDGLRFFSVDEEEITKKPVTIDWDANAAEKGGYEHFMLKEIYEQPKTINDTISPRIKDNDIVIEELNMSDEEIQEITKIHIVACGSAYHTGVTAKYVIEGLARIPVEVDVASEFRYRDPILTPRTLVVAISQSGETMDTLMALRHAREQGSKVLAICNTQGASIPRESDAVLYTHAGPEVAVASTKAFVAQITAAYVLGLYLAQVKGAMFRDEIAQALDSLKDMPRKIQWVLDTQTKTVHDAAAQMVDAKSFLFLGRHVGYPVAMEGALKLKEIAYTFTEGFAAGELKHGPIALVDEGEPVVFIVPPARGRNVLHAKVISGIEEVKARGAYIIAVAEENDPDVERYADVVFWRPACPTLMSPLVDVVPLQLLAMDMAKLKNYDVDKPRNLAKSVTVE